MSTSTLKRCHFTNLQNGYRCGCLRFVPKSGPDNDDLCKGCGHYQSYHEDDDCVLQNLNNFQKFYEVLICVLNNNKYNQHNQYIAPTIPHQQNFENWFEPPVNVQSDETMHPSIPTQNAQLNDTMTPVQHQDQQSIQVIHPNHAVQQIKSQNQSHGMLNQSPMYIEHNFVPHSFPVNYVSNSTVDPMFSVQTNLDQSHVNYNIGGSSNNIAPFMNDKFELICLVGSLKIPKNCARLEEAGLKKEICFHDDSKGQIKRAIEEKLPHLKYVEWLFYKCKASKLVLADDVSIDECRYEDIKRISGSRKKLYIGTKNGPIIMALKK